jgi:hypothetical protein
VAGTVPFPTNLQTNIGARLKKQCRAFEIGSLKMTLRLQSYRAASLAVNQHFGGRC